MTRELVNTMVDHAHAVCNTPAMSPRSCRTGDGPGPGHIEGRRIVADEGSTRGGTGWTLAGYSRAVGSSWLAVAASVTGAASPAVSPRRAGRSRGFTSTAGAGTSPP